MNDIKWLCTDGTSGEGDKSKDFLFIVLRNKIEQGHTVILSPTEQYMEHKGWVVPIVGGVRLSNVRTIIEPSFLVVTCSGLLAQISRENSANEAIWEAYAQLKEGLLSYYT